VAAALSGTGSIIAALRYDAYGVLGAFSLTGKITIL
jgi:hypothetical protein